VEALNLKARILVEKSQYQKAAQAYELALKSYEGETNTDRSLFHLGVLYFKHLNNSEKAIELFTNLLRKYPSSVFCVEARQWIQKARQKPVQ
jgi:TolA-binding protein